MAEVTRISDEDVFRATDMYIAGEIGTCKLRELCGLGNRTNPKQRPRYKRYLKMKGIKAVKNNIDMISVCNGHLSEGTDVGYILYEDGRTETIRYHETGRNDVFYAARESRWDCGWQNKPGPRCPAKPDEEVFRAIDRYAAGEIGVKELKAICGWCSQGGLTRLSQYRRYLSLNGIRRIINNYDTLCAHCGVPAVGDVIGSISYVDGSATAIRYMGAKENAI